GDAAFTWATGHSANYMALTGHMFAVKIGRHRCWFMPVFYPNFVHKKNRRSNDEYELAFRKYIKTAVDVAEDANTLPPTIYDAPYDGGIKIITGQEAGDMQRLEEALHRSLRNPFNGFDIETSGLRPWLQRNPHIWTTAVGSFEDTTAFAVDHPDGW